ncbi:hypothetical protein RRG08_047981 [Elysia crispata]|uniref:Uncharacterized protein n=1 Tax=Elysia crispata TaxID=231223 RepID=A0AAE0ZUB1_9GAST|nr:hypothetical protein RRG08_047981 [Elysia crispata]
MFSNHQQVIGEQREGKVHDDPKNASAMKSAGFFSSIPAQRPEHTAPMVMSGGPEGGSLTPCWPLLDTQKIWWSLSYVPRSVEFELCPSSVEFELCPSSLSYVPRSVEFELCPSSVEFELCPSSVEFELCPSVCGV